LLNHISLALGGTRSQICDSIRHVLRLFTTLNAEKEPATFRSAEINSDWGEKYKIDRRCDISCYMLLKDGGYMAWKLVAGCQGK
jgi:hypothetical protein